MDHDRPIYENVARHLHESIERLRRSTAEVRFWADMLAELAEPVPEYDPDEVSVWFPPEQAVALSPSMRRRRREPS